MGKANQQKWEGTDGYIADSELQRVVNVAAHLERPLLIRGEPGTGKTLLAHSIAEGLKMPLITWHVKSTTQAKDGLYIYDMVQRLYDSRFQDKDVSDINQYIRMGPLGQAFKAQERSVLLIDEIDKLPSATQVRLVRLVTDNEIQPLGSPHSYRIDVRLITAADEPLEPMLAAGTFREDLFYRINVVQLAIPPLRERTGDLSALARHFLARLATQPGLRSLGITDEALALLRAYDWPGNVRQLQDVLFRASVLCEGDALTAAEFPLIAEAVRASGVATAPPTQHADGIGVTLYEADGNLRPLDAIEADVIRLAIGHYRGRMTEVARRLGIGRSTLYRKLADLGIDNAAA